MAFVKGQSGNPGGRKRTETIFRDAILLALKREDGDNKLKIAKLAEALVDKAIDGDVPAAREVMDRIDGRVPQPIDHSGEVDHTYIARTPAISKDIDDWHHQHSGALLPHQTPQ